MKNRPRVLVLTAPGINRSVATQVACEAAGGQADIVHINQFKNREVTLKDYRVLVIPGGFSYGDHIQSGRILAMEFQYNNLLIEQIYKHLEKGGLILGVCNGFQVLVQSGLLPFGKIHPLDENTVTLTRNLPDRFQSRWIYLKPTASRCVFVQDGWPITLPVAHGEGRFLAPEKVLKQLVRDQQIVYTYCSPNGEAANGYPENPNGSSLGIAGICDPSGQILGMMPHAEDFVRPEHYPNWRREKKNPDGLKFFQQLMSVTRKI